MRFGEEIFEGKFASRVQRILPTMFNMVELENKRGEKLGMEVGTARERVIIAMFMYIYGSDVVKFPPSTSSEIDVLVNGNPVSIKTKMNAASGAGVKLVWTSDWDRVDQFVDEYMPTSHLLFINVTWGEESGFYLIDRSTQRELWRDMGRDYFKIPRRGTNPRGVEMSREAMLAIQGHKDTLSMMILWNRPDSLLRDRHLYGRWVDLWNSL